MGDTADQLYERILVHRCQGGDQGAFEELIVRYTPRLRYFLRKLLGDLQGAEDVLQDVWLDAFRAMSRLLDPGTFPAWIYRIARDRAFRTLRRRRFYEPLVDSKLADQTPKVEEFSVEDVARIHTALNTLVPEHREVLILRFLEEMSYEEIARVVDCRVGTVRSRIHYAKRALREIIERNSSP